MTDWCGRFGTLGNGCPAAANGRRQRRSLICQPVANPLGQLGERGGIPPGQVGLLAPPQFVFRHNQVEQAFRVLGQVGKTVAVLLDPRRFSPFEARLQVDVDQFQQNGFAVGRARGQIIVDVRPLAALPAASKRLQISSRRRWC